MNYLQFDFATQSTEQSEQLVALLNEQGFEGFEEDENNLIAFIPENKFDDTEFAKVIEMFSSLSYIQSLVENVNWNKKWEDNFEPVLVNNFVVIRAAFHQSIPSAQHEIIITPKMSFGTGHHATTFLMIQQMRELDFTRKSVLDFGTGTGILAILAEKLGAAKILAIDNDEWSITNASENIRQNDCSKIIIAQYDSVPIEEKFDIILANINLAVIISNLKRIVMASHSGTIVLISGFLKENRTEIIAAIEQNGFNHLSTHQKGDWITILAEKKWI